jgi:hypothetical protein
MGSAGRAALLQLLLRQIDRHPPGVVDGADLVHADPVLVERLLEERILVQEAPLEDVGPDPLSEGELPRRVCRRGGELVAFSAEGGSAPEQIDPRELVQYPIDIACLCRAIRDDNGLGHAEPEILSSRTVLVGRKDDPVGRRPVVLCRLLNDRNVYETIHMLSSRLSAERLILVTPTERTLGIDAMNSLGSRGIDIVPAEHALQDSAVHAFALRWDGCNAPADSTPGSRAELFVDIGAHQAFLFGHELKMRPREFKVLIALARAYPSGRYVPSDELYDIVYLATRKRDISVYDEQIGDAVSRLRTVLREAAKSKGRSIGRGIQTKKKIGYRLDRAIASVQTT